MVMAEYTLDKERLRMRRLKLRLSQQRLGELLGQDQGYVSRLERGEIADITLRTFARLAEALQVSMEYLVGKGDDDSERQAVELAAAGT
jgi:transcriptional regulator with XRE-family HTH domain